MQVDRVQSRRGSGGGNGLDLAHFRRAPSRSPGHDGGYTLEVFGLRVANFSGLGFEFFFSSVSTEWVFPERIHVHPPHASLAVVDRALLDGDRVGDASALDLPARAFVFEARHCLQLAD